MGIFPLTHSSNLFQVNIAKKSKIYRKGKDIRKKRH